MSMYTYGYRALVAGVLRPGRDAALIEAARHAWADEALAAGWETHGVQTRVDWFDLYFVTPPGRPRSLMPAMDALMYFDELPEVDVWALHITGDVRALP